MTVISLLFICFGLTLVLCWQESVDSSSVGVNRIVAASNLGSRGKKNFPPETKCEFLNRSRHYTKYLDLYVMREQEDVRKG